jgi:RNA polymerase sigma-70 factor (ECF subfamily)
MPVDAHAAPGPSYLGAAIARCAGGDSAALRAMYDLEAGKMLGVAYRILRRRDLAEEAVQDAFVQIWRKAASFDSERGGTGRGWIYAVLRNRALSILRDGRREDLTENPLSLEAIDNAPDPEAIVVRLSQNSRLKHCLELIGERQRTVLFWPIP